jgi:hypothetical protein
MQRKLHDQLLYPQDGCADGWLEYFYFFH